MSARSRAIRAHTDRLEDTREKKVLSRAIQQPAQYAGNNRIKSLGAAGSVPVRGRLSTGGVAVGEPVTASQGVIAGLQDAVTNEQLTNALSLVLEKLGNIRNHRGIITFSGDPNTSDPPAYKDFNYQILHRTDNDTLYYWVPGDGTIAGVWTIIPISGSGLTIASEGTALPTQPVLNFSGAGVTATDDATNTRTNVVIPGGGSGGGLALTYALVGPDVGSSGTTITPPAGGYLDGHIWIHTGIERVWIYRQAGSNNWIPMGSKNFTYSPPATYSDALEIGDTITAGLYQWYWDGVDWVKNYCCDTGPDDPPPDGGGSCDWQWLPSCPGDDGSDERWTCGCP